MDNGRVGSVAVEFLELSIAQNWTFYDTYMEFHILHC